MKRVIDPLARKWAPASRASAGGHAAADAPGRGAPAVPITYRLPVASAQVKERGAAGGASIPPASPA